MFGSKLFTDCSLGLNRERASSNTHRTLRSRSLSKNARPGCALETSGRRLARDPGDDRYHSLSNTPALTRSSTTYRYLERSAPSLSARRPVDERLNLSNVVCSHFDAAAREGRMRGPLRWTRTELNSDSRRGIGLSVRFSRTVRRHLRGRAATLIATLLFVPPLVHATQHLSRGTTSSLLRLNRGFDAPETKCQLAPPRDVVLRCIVLEEPNSAQIARRALAADEPIPDSPRDSTPDALRGPPLAQLA